MCKKSRRVLLFGGTEGAPHDYKAVCPVLEGYLKEMPDLEADYIAEDYDAFLAERLAPYDALVLYHTAGELSAQQESGLLDWVASGKVFIGIHGAACSFKGSDGYFEMLGARFTAHPFIREYTVSLVDESPGITFNHNHPILAGLEGYSVKHWEEWPVYEYRVVDEQYLFDRVSDFEALAAGMFKGVSVPASWVKPWGKGRVFYLALGHNADACRNDFFKKIFSSGVRWAAGLENASG